MTMQAAALVSVPIPPAVCISIGGPDVTRNVAQAFLIEILPGGRALASRELDDWRPRSLLALKWQGKRRRSRCNPQPESQKRRCEFAHFSSL